jgi:hypothetical protein
MSTREIKRTTSDKPIPGKEKRRSLLDILSGKKDGKTGISFSSNMDDSEQNVETLQEAIEEEVKRLEQEGDTEKIEKINIISRCKKKENLTFKSKNLN